MEWVAVEDQLPEPWTKVLVYPRPTDYCCEAQIGRAGAGVFWEYSEYGRDGVENYECHPTHWCYMHPPKATE